jgi:hypothetical protein
LLEILLHVVYFVAKIFPVFTYLIVSTHFHLFCVLSDFLVFLVNQWVTLTGKHR